MKKLSILALACLMLGAASMASAEGFALYEWSARGVALGGSTMARAADPSVLASNPAAMTQLKGAQVQAGVTVVAPYGKMKFNSGPDAGETYELKNKIWPVPSMYYTQQINERLFIGVGEFSRFGLGFEYPEDWGGRYNIYDASVVTASVNPNLAYKVTDKLSLAIGVEIMYVDITLKKKVDATGGMAPGMMDIDFDNNVKNWEYAGNFALHYQFNDQWAFGAAYRTRLKHEVDGTLKVDTTDPTLGGLGIRDQDFTATVYMPDSVSFGVAYSPSPKLTLEAGAVWTHWSQFTDLDFTFDHPINGSRLQENKKYWNNTWRLNIGVEYALKDWLDLRAGYVWDQCPVPKEYEDYLIPTDNRHIMSIGAGFKPRNWTIDVAYAFVLPRAREYNEERRAEGVYESKPKDSGSHVASLSIGYKF